MIVCLKYIRKNKQSICTYKVWSKKILIIIINNLNLASITICLNHKRIHNGMKKMIFFHWNIELMNLILKNNNPNN